MTEEEARKLARAKLESQDEARYELLSAMQCAAGIDAADHLSLAGKEVLAMLQQSEHVDMSILDAFIESAAFDELPEADQAVIQVYLARVTLIEVFRVREG